MDDQRPDIIARLANGSTIELGCRTCGRAHVVDMVEMLDCRGLGFQMRDLRDRMRCRSCGGRPAFVSSQMVDTLRRVGRLHRLATTDASDFRHPAFAPRPPGVETWRHNSTMLTG